MESLKENFAVFDLRFKEKQTEACFKESVEPEVLRFGMLGAIILEVLIPLTLVPVYIEEASSTSNPYDMSKTDVRTVMLIMWLLCFAVMGVYISLGMLRIWRGWFTSWNWELIFVCVITYYSLNLALCNFWHLPLILGDRPDRVWTHNARGAEVYILLALDGIMTVTAMYIPIRACALWVLSICGVATYIIMLVVVDSVFPDDRFKSVSALVALTAVAYHGAYRNEKQRREKWIALQQVIEATEIVKQQETEIAETTAMVKGLRTVAHALCDIVVKLTEDLRVCGTESMLDAFFEKEMEGRLFSEVLADGDCMRFQALVTNMTATQVHACMPVTIRKKSSICEASLLLVDTGRKMPRYFLGIRAEMEHLEPVGGQAGYEDLKVGPPEHEFVSLVPQVPKPMSTQRNLGAVPTPGGGSVSDEQDSDFSFTTFQHKHAGQQLAYTSMRARAISLKKVMPRWNIARDVHSCCQFHTVVESIHEVADFLAEKQCEPLWSTLSGGQCARCKSMCTQTRTKCVVCGFSHGH